MESPFKPIALEEKSYNVNLLHKALAALGLAVAKNEVTQGNAGKDTLTKVRVLQAKLNVTVDESVLVDEETARTMATAMKERGLSTASRSFTVSGTARLDNGAVAKRQRLLAFDLDLRGVAVYRTIQISAEIEKNGGFEFLGEAASDAQGNYRITFYDWQYGQAERKKADVVVYALAGDTIIGRSRLVNSEDYSDKGLVRHLDVIITQEDTRTEYAALMSALNAFLKESNASLAAIAQSQDQLSFTAAELDVELLHLNVAASAELLTMREQPKLSHELLYGVGRQNIRLAWAVLFKKREDELRKAIAQSVVEGIIQGFKEEDVNAFLQALRARAAAHMLDDGAPEGSNLLTTMLSTTLPEKEQRLAFMNALGTFNGGNYREFWREHLPAQPAFKDKPELISGLLLTQQFTLLTGNHQPLVHKLLADRQLSSTSQMMELEKSDWLELIKETGVPDFIAGGNDDEKADKYVALMQGLLNAAFPTQRIARMVEKRELPIERTDVSKSISTFLAQNEQFDFAGSRVHAFKNELKGVAGDDYDEVRAELMKIQRVFQVSTTPEAMKALLENKLLSAHTIASIPRKSFIKRYGQALGGERAAFAIHQRASHINTRAEMAAMHLLEYSHGLMPKTVMDEHEYERAMEVIKNHMPNPTPSYVELFGSPDTCECEHCRSVYSPAAYFVELLRFLSFGGIKSAGKTPLDVLETRRPDLRHLLLTCENTNTVIPYIDLANEVMEFYTASGSLASFMGHDTGDATAEELRANPQHFDLEAYRILSNNHVTKRAVYPFTLPYHQPLDVIRTYSDHLGVSRYEAMVAMNPQPDAATRRAIEAEALGLSEEETAILTPPDATLAHEYFGYATAGELEDLSEVREFLERSGVAYTDLVELVKTQFINPHQGTLDFLERVISHATIGAATIYTRLEQIEAGTLNATGRAQVQTILTAYNNAAGASLTFDQFADWVREHSDGFRQVITLYEPESKCDLDTTQLRTLQSIYEGSPTSGITEDTWSKSHRFIRLWRKLGWTIHETDLMLAALGEDDITPTTISKLASVCLLHASTRLPLDQLAVLWGNIDSYGSKSLYKKLFLNKAVQEIDPAFKADAWGDYLQDEAQTLADHQSGIRAAFRITEEELAAIVAVATVNEGGTARHLVLDSDGEPDPDWLNIQNLSTIYRFVVLAKALKAPVADLCKLSTLFDASPFSTWDVDGEEFTSISPQDTLAFYELAAATKDAGFKPAVLEYILQGALPADSTIGLDRDKTLQTAKTIRDAFTAIERDLPETPAAPLTADIVAAKLSLTFQPEIVRQFVGIVQGAATFETITDDNLDVTIPAELVAKYRYIRGSGRLTCVGVMTDGERVTLKDLAPASVNFQAAVDEMYEAPATFIAENFNGAFDDLVDAHAVLLDHPAQPTAASLDVKLNYVCERYLPLLKRKLRKDAIAQQIAALIGLSEEATALLIAAEVDTLIDDLSGAGFSATYFSDANWTTPVSSAPTLDSAIDFSWESAAPDPRVMATDNFSVRWEAYIAAPASGTYTLLVDVAEADEAFNLYLDGSLILTQAAGDGRTSLEWDVELNAARLHCLKLEYAEDTGNAGVRLRWKTATTGVAVMPAAVAFPAHVLDGFVESATQFHRAAKFIAGFKLSASELDHVIRFPCDFDADSAPLDFMDLAAGHWQRINDYVTLRNAVPQAQAFLTDVFALANDPAATINDLIGRLNLATAWDRANLEYLVAQFGLSVDHFKNEIALNWLHQVMRIVSKTGLAAQTIAQWGRTDTDFDALHETAKLLKHTVKAKYEAEEWLKLAGTLSDKLREHQRQALISYLLTQPDIQTADVRDADGLFEYFLIDVQMGACMDTSRIVQANAAIQMFVNRCLMNLERDVSPDAIDKERWEWMKNYRVWEANRKVFLYPENWLEPEWRTNRSEFFKELESYLVQNDITARSVEQGLRTYLTSLNEVAVLDVCGLHRENHPDGTLKYLHVFARTNNAPYKFFYRRWDEFGKWSAWEKVQLDIRSVEAGDDSGVHLIPVVWKNRLFLFWPEFFRKSVEDYDSNLSAEKAASDPQKLSELEADEYWEIKLAWSEYVDGKWSPKQVSKEYVDEVRPELYSIENEKDLLFTAHVIQSTQELTIDISRAFVASNYIVGQFLLSDIQSQIQQVSPKDSDPDSISCYTNIYGEREAEARLELMDATYLGSETSHRLLPVNTHWRLNITLDNPFFFSHAQRTYFVHPVEIEYLRALQHPTNSRPFIPQTESSPLRNEEVFVAGSQTDHMIEIGHIGEPFGGTVTPGTTMWGGPRPWLGLPRDTGLEFHTFYHPFSSEYVTRLNRGGIPVLMSSDTEVPSGADRLFDFVDYFDATDLVRRAWAFDTPSDPKTAYLENVCFDVKGANSLYNWELFFHAPLYIATRLSKNGKYAEAMKWFHYIFDPMTDEAPEPGNETARYWQVLPFKTIPPYKSLEDWFSGLLPNADPGNDNPDIKEWRDNPFDAHRVASNRPLAYMKHVVVKYVENLIAWGDSLFRQFTRESVNEALQLYVSANHILGPRPQFVPKRGEIKAESYDSLKEKWDDFSNALVQLENIFPYSSEVSASGTASGPSMLGIGSALYFCIPENDRSLEYWDKVADRLFKIRHCQDIDGVERQLALFAPPISPEALIQALSKGLSLGSILADLSSPPPIYRFPYLMQKANEFCSDVKALGSALLAALEKKDAEELSRMRASHETSMLELATAIKERQVLDAKAYKESLLKTRETSQFRLQHHLDLLGIGVVDFPAAPTVNATLTADSQLPGDTPIPVTETAVDTSLVESGETGVKLIPHEKRELDSSQQASDDLFANMAAEVIAGFMGLIPQFAAHGTPLGVGAATGFGGRELGWFAGSAAKMFATSSQMNSLTAAKSSKMASYIRREQEWALQANLAAKEIIQLDKQITSADIRIQVAEKELENHRKQIENAQDVERFLKDKFTNQELYQWMKEQLFAVYKQSYNLAFDMAKKAEKAYQYEMGTETASFIQYGYWDNSMQGLVAGEKLQLALRQLEKSYLEENRRELELTKHISLAMLDPETLIRLRETGECLVNLPEAIFDLDYAGHYMRRIKAVSLTIPCVAGPYVNISATLTLLSSRVRKNTNRSEGYTYSGLDDTRFRHDIGAIQSIATSGAQNDSGLFELNFRDERYLPFEGAGAISSWRLELPDPKQFPQFDYNTISDVIMHLRYTAREGGDAFKKTVTGELSTAINEMMLEQGRQGLYRLFSAKQEFSNEWHSFLYPHTEQMLVFDLAPARFPFQFRDKTIRIDQVNLLVKLKEGIKSVPGDNFELALVYSGGPAESRSPSASLSPFAASGGLFCGVVEPAVKTDANEELWLLSATSIPESLSKEGRLDPEKIDDIAILVHYTV